MLFNQEELNDLLQNSAEVIEQDASLKGKLLAFYRYAFAEQPCGNCQGKIHGYLMKLKKIDMDTINENKSREFNFKNDTICVPVKFGQAQMFTNANLTDEKAIEILAENPKRAGLFAKLPEGWEERVNSYIEQVKAQEESESIDQVIEHMKAGIVKDLVSEIKDTDDLDLLKSMLLAEEGEKNRAGVISAITAQIEALESLNPA